MKNILKNLLWIGIASILLVSCSSGNKVVSSFGKRKYTKGYFFNSVAHKKMESPAIAANKDILANRKVSSVVNTHLSSQEQSIISQSKTLANSSIDGVSRHSFQNKLNLFKPLQILSGVKHFAITKGNIENILNEPVGVPEHGKASTADGKGDSAAKSGCMLGLIAAFLIVVMFILPVFSSMLIVFIALASIICTIAGLASSIAGLKSKEYQSSAIIGLILSILSLIFWILVILIIAYIANYI